MIVAVDFDNTLFYTEYPDIIEPRLDIINKCISLRENGNILILWTCREGENLHRAVKACADAGLIFDYINSNTDELTALYGESRKVGADYYLDDKCVSFGDFLKL